MNDLSIIQHINHLRRALTSWRDTISPQTYAVKRFNRRVALYARDAGVPVHVARKILTLKDREYAARIAA